MIYVAALHPENNIPGPSRPEQDLCELLKAAEIRKSKEIKRTAKSINLVVGVPIALLVLWAVVFLLTYTPSPVRPAKTTTPVSLASQLSPKEEQNPFADMALDGKDRVATTNLLGRKETSGKIVDKEDIYFAMELLNFVNPPERADKKQK